MSYQSEQAAAAQKYLDLKRQGVPAREAIKQAWPNGVPTAQDQNKAKAKESQTGTVLQVGGTVAGSIASKKLVEALSSKASEEVVKKSAEEVVRQSGQQIAQEQATSTAATEGTSQAAGSQVALSPGYMGPTPAYVPAAAAIGTYLAGKSAYDQLQGHPDDKSPQGRVGRAQLAFTTMGGSELARAFGIGGQDTREAQRKVWSGLSGIDGIDAQNKINQQVASSDMAGKMLSANGQVQKWNFNDALNQVKAGQTDQFRGVAGNFQTFGNDWNKWSPDQQNKVVSALANAGLYNSDHGSIFVSNQDQAKALAAKALGGAGTTTPAIPTNKPTTVNSSSSNPILNALHPRKGR